MKRARSSRDRGIGALALIEEATSLVRRAPADVLGLYYLGTLPFVLGLLYFWADMSRSADAAGRLAGGSLGVALLFVWMKYWQARFCGGLSRLVGNGSVTQSAPRTAVTQTVFQPWGLVLLPLAIFIALPFGWCYAFFQNITVIGGGPDLRAVYGSARRQAALWPGQNHLLILIISLLGLVVFANLCVTAYLLPRVVKTLFGVESLFSRSNLFLLNSTFWAAMAALTHLCIDPLIKAVYLLRCHYGESLSSGADLLADLREARGRAGVGLTVLLLAGAVLLTGVPLARASDTVGGKAASSPAVSAQKLNRTIQQVISGPEFSWRLPRPPQPKNEMPGFLRSAIDLLKEWSHDVGRWIGRFFEWLSEFMPRFKPDREGPSRGWGFPDYVFPLMYGLLAICLSAGAVMFWRQARFRRRTAPEAAASSLVMTPDVSDENVMADELTEDRWRALARELLAKGELRLGLRALYLACLACLAEERLITIARFKSNRDYEREVGRFGHALPEVAGSFSRNLDLFERAWYGMHGLEQETVDAFIANYERILSGVRQG